MISAYQATRQVWLEDVAPYLVLGGVTSFNSIPSAPVLSFVSKTSNSITYSWAAVSGATGYKFYKNGVLFDSNAASPYTLSGLSYGTSYDANVTASNASGDSSLSNTITQTTNNPAGYDAWLAQTIALGATAPTATKNAVKQFFADFATAGFGLSDFDYLYLMIGEASGDSSANQYNQKRVNLVNPGTFDATVSNPNSSGHGAAGTVGNASMYWDTGFRAATALVNRAGNASFGLIPTNISSGSGVTDMGVLTVPNAILQPNYAGGTYAYYGGSGIINPALVTAPCLFYLNMVSNVTTLYRNATSLATNSSGTGAVPVNNVYVFGFNNNPAASQVSNHTLAAAWHGRSMNSTERTAWYSMLQTLMADFSVTI